MANNLKTKEIFAMATDPIYIGTGGFTIGRVDNTIVRDPITNIPKIPGSSLAGTWRYYVALELQSYFKDEYKKELAKRKGENIEKLFENPKDWMKNFDGNRYARITCAGQDEASNVEIDSKQNTGHCGHCIVCKSFGYSKKDKSSQGMLFFSDLNILFFPVFTRLGVRWITSKRILEEAGLLNGNIKEKEVVLISEKEQDNTNYINLGWLNLPYEKIGITIDLSKLEQFNLTDTDIIIVPDSLISQIINSNLEVRTSVSIDPITGAAKEKALFTSEAIPRGTVFYGEIRCFRREGDDSLPEISDVCNALDDTKHYYESLGIGGMTTRGFGRIKILSFLELDENKNGNN